MVESSDQNFQPLYNENGSKKPGVLPTHCWLKVARGKYQYYLYIHIWLYSDQKFHI